MLEFTVEDISAEEIARRVHARLGRLDAGVDGARVLVLARLGRPRRAADADDAAVHIAAYGLLGMVFAAGDAWLQHASFPREQLVDTLTSLYVDGAARLAMPSTTRTSATNTTASPDTTATDT